MGRGQISEVGSRREERGPGDRGAWDAWGHGVGKETNLGRQEGGVA